MVGGVDPDDTSDPAAFRAALDAAGFVVSLELRETDVTRAADVVLPVAPVADKAGTFVTWDGRARDFGAVFTNPASLPDLRILSGIADELGPVRSGFRTVRRGARGDAVARSVGRRAPGPRRRQAAPRRPRPPRRGRPPFALATWKQLIDLGSMQDGEEHLRATARTPVARLNQASYESVFGMLETAGSEALATITGDRGSVTLPVVVADLPDEVVWVPARSFGRGVLAELASPGSTVTVKGASACSDEHPAAGSRPARPGAGAVRSGPVVGDRPQGGLHLLDPGPADALQHLVRASGRGPHAAPRRAQRARSLRPAAVAGRRRQARAQGGHHPEGGRQGRVLHRPGHRAWSRPSSPGRSSRSGPRSTSSATAPRSS